MSSLILGAVMISGMRSAWMAIGMVVFAYYILMLRKDNKEMRGASIAIPVLSLLVIMMSYFLSPTVQDRVQRTLVMTEDIEAYAWYLKGREADINWLDYDHAQLAYDMYQAAVERDPDFVEALGKICHLGAWIYNTGHADQATLDGAGAAGEKALSLEADNFEALVDHSRQHQVGRDLVFDTGPDLVAVDEGQAEGAASWPGAEQEAAVRSAGEAGALGVGVIGEVLPEIVSVDGGEVAGH